MGNRAETKPGDLGTACHAGLCLVHCKMHLAKCGTINKYSSMQIIYFQQERSEEGRKGLNITLNYLHSDMISGNSKK